MRPNIYLPEDHGINTGIIDRDALHVIEKLKKAGYDAFLVGGSVRDLLTQRAPKDYDVSTSAQPEQIKRLFGRQCLLIGRRFRLAHIRFGHKIIEVATFRKGESSDALITRDNEWGTAEEDVLRRDFTINGLFYDPANHSVIDYVGGWQDIQSQTLRSIGDAAVRFRQDPVRMIRLLKFHARFGFTISNACKRALLTSKEEITKSAPARLQEELLRMLESGAAARFFKLMTDSGLLALIFPELTSFLESDHGSSSYGLLEQADAIHNNGSHQKLDRAILVASLLYPILDLEIATRLSHEGTTLNLGEIMILSSTIVNDFVSGSLSRFPKRITISAAYIMMIQYRLTPLSGRRNLRAKLMHQKEFALALQFLKMRAMLNPELKEEYTHCNNLYQQHVPHHQREPHPPPKPKRKPRRRSSSGRRSRD